MADYKSELASIPHNINIVYSKLSNPESINSLMSMLPPEAKEKIKDVTFSKDSIIFKANGVGEITLKATELIEPTKIVFSAVSSPLPFKVIISLEEVNDNTTNGQATISVDVPVFLKPMLNGPLNQATERFKELLTNIPYDRI